MVLLGFTLGLLEMVLLAAFLMALVLGISLDRGGRTAPKWYIFGFGMIAIAAVNWGDFTFSGMYDTISSWTFWKPMFMYLAVGVVYSILEFILDVRKASRRYKDAWESALLQNINHRARNSTEKISLKEAINRRPDLPENEPLIADIFSAINGFVSHNNYSNAIIKLEYNKETMESPQPKIDKTKLAEFIGAWTFFWPIYLISLIIGDLFTEIFNQLSGFFVNVGGRFVKMVFKDVFKV